MKTNIADQTEARAASALSRSKRKLRGPALLLLAFSFIFGATGCEDTYSTYPNGYGPRYAAGPYVAGPGPYAPGPYTPGPYGPGYAPYAGNVTVEIGDRPVLQPRSWLLRRPRLLRLAPRPLEEGQWLTPLGPWPIRHERPKRSGAIRRVALEINDQPHFNGRAGERVPH